MTDLERRKTSEIAPEEFVPEHTLDYYVEQRADNKRNYIFRYKDALKCDHPTMRLVARGGNVYVCPDCKYTFQWPGAIVYPQHFNVIMGAFTMLNFAKEYGMDSLQEVLRRPIGQTDGTPHKPVLPEGMNFYDAMLALEDVDTTAADGGMKQLTEMVDALWVGPKEREKQVRLATRQAVDDKALAEKKEQKSLEAGNGSYEVQEEAEADEKANVPSV
jgi:hypothetical protein